MSKFYVWIDNPSTQIETSEEFANESQRLVGYIANTKISSKIMNTILRQTSLVTVALMEALGVSNNIDGSSSIEEVKNEILDKLVRTQTTVDDSLSLTSERPVQNKVITKAIDDLKLITIYSEDEGIE